MATLTVTLADHVKALAEARAADAGYADVGEYLTGLIQGEAAGAPDGMSIESDEQLEALLLSRSDGPWVEASADDFRRLRERLAAHLDGAGE